MKKLKLTLYIKTGNLDRQGKAPIMIKIIMPTAKTTLSSGLSIEPERWQNTIQLIKSRVPSEINLRAKIDQILREIELTYQKLEDRNIPFGPKLLKKAYLNAQESPLNESVMLSELFNKHQSMIEPLVKVGDRAPETLRKYRTLRSHVGDYLLYKFSLDDIALNKLSHEFIEGLDIFLRYDKGIGNNTTVKYIQAFRSIIRMGIKYDYLVKDPFKFYEKKVKHKDVIFLSEVELAAIEATEFDSPRLEVTRDIFVFACYTGYAPVDIMKLTWDNVETGNDGALWIRHKRTKTGVKADVPLLPQAERIINKYKAHPQCVDGKHLVPPRSNQKLNTNLKELADYACIKKKLHMYIARHTFACTVILANGLSIEVLSKMMGHTNIKQTQAYGRIQEQRVSEEMSLLRSKFKKD